MIKIFFFLVILQVLTVGNINAQSGWKKNSAGHDVFVYKPESIPTYKPSPNKSSGKNTNNDDGKLKTDNSKPRINDGIYIGYYDGSYVNGKREGKGIFTFENGDKYEGEWKADQMHGEGIYKYKSAGVYVGNYKEGKMEGQGTFKFKNGDYYKGSWLGGRREGYGTYIIYSSGAIYEGGFVNNEFYGQGKLTERDSTGRKGFFKGAETNMYSLEYFIPESMNLVGKQIQDFGLRTYDGTYVSMASFKGKYVLLIFWELTFYFVDVHEGIEDLLTKYKQNGFRAFSIAQETSGRRYEWKSEIETNKPSWPQAYGYEIDEVQYNYFRKLNRAYYSNILVDPKGKIIGQNLFGYVLESELKKIFKR
jgi:hypothetical protein